MLPSKNAFAADTATRRAEGAAASSVYRGRLRVPDAAPPRIRLARRFSADAPRLVWP